MVANKLVDVALVNTIVAPVRLEIVALLIVVVARVDCPFTVKDPRDESDDVATMTDDVE